MISAIVFSYKIALGFEPKGKKEVQGDGKTPEGTYYINDKNPSAKPISSCSSTSRNIWPDIKSGFVTGGKVGIMISEINTTRPVLMRIGILRTPIPAIIKNIPVTRHSGSK